MLKIQTTIINHINTLDEPFIQFDKNTFPAYSVHHIYEALIDLQDKHFVRDVGCNEDMSETWCYPTILSLEHPEYRCEQVKRFFLSSILVPVIVTIITYLITVYVGIILV